jgi:Protein of unknown function (DUF2459).
VLAQNFIVVLLSLLLIPAEKAKCADTLEVFVIQQEYHTGISLKAADVNLAVWPECAEFKSFTWVDVGWGERKYYQSPDSNPLLAVKAIAMPNLSVMRIEGYSEHPNIYLSGCPSVKILLSREQFDRLCAVFHNAYARDRNGNIVETSGNAQYKFYSAKGSYHLMNTCNTWVARAFRKAGLNVHIFGIITASQLFKALKPFSEKDKERSKK